MKGQGLIEVLIALAIAVVFISAVSISILSALDNAQHNKNENLATDYAQQGMEFMKNLQVSNNSNFNSLQWVSANNGYCLADTSCNQLNITGDGKNCGSSINGSACVPITGTIFNRTVIVHRANNGLGGPDPGFNCNANGSGTGATKQIDVIVSWSDNKCTNPNQPYCNSVDVSSCFSDIYAVPTP